MDEFNQEDINVFYAMFGRSCLPLKECGQRLFLGLYGTTTTGKTLLLDLLKYAHPVICVGTFDAKPHSQFGLNGGGNTLNVIDEVFELRNATVEQMKNLIDGSETGIKKSVIYGGDVTSIWQGMLAVTANNHGDTSKIFKNLNDNDGALNNRFVGMYFTKEVRAKDMELGKKLKKQMPQVLDRAALMRLKLNKNNRSLWELLSNESTIRKFHDGRANTSQHLANFLSMCCTVRVNARENKTLGMYNEVKMRQGVPSSFVDMPDDIKKEWKKKASYDNGDETLLYREPLEKVKKGYARYLRTYLPHNKRITDPKQLDFEVKKEFGVGFESILWNDYKIAVKTRQIGNGTQGSITWCIGIKMNEDVSFTDSTTDDGKLIRTYLDV